MSDWPVWLLAIVDVLAAHRLARLVTEDVITTRPRRAIIRWSYQSSGYLSDDLAVTDERLYDWEALIDSDMVEDPGGAPRTAVLVRCRWCASIWLAAGVVIAHSTIPSLWLPVAGLLALSSASTLLAGLED